MDNKIIPLDECRVSLLNRKKNLLNRLDLLRRDFSERQTQGDEADQSVALLNENRMFINNQRIRKELLEIEAALHRITKGIFGICEETDEPIEVDRLLAMPWTRVSLEGAEIREENQSRFA